MKIAIQPSALADLRRGVRFYERQGQGLGQYFLDSLYSDIDSLQLYAGVHATRFGKFHRLLSEKFPYAVYYQVRGETAYVRAVLDLREDPVSIARKLERLK